MKVQVMAMWDSKLVENQCIHLPSVLRSKLQTQLPLSIYGDWFQDSSLVPNSKDAQSLSVDGYSILSCTSINL